MRKIENFKIMNNKNFDFNSPMAQSSLTNPSVSESDLFFPIGSEWMNLEKEKLELKKRIEVIEDKQKTLEEVYPQVANLRGLINSKIKVKVDITSPPPQILKSPLVSISSSSISASSSSSLSSPISSLSISTSPGSAKKRKSIVELEKKEETKEEKNDKKEEKKRAPGEKSKSQLNREKAKRRLEKKIAKDSLPPDPMHRLLLNTRDVNQSILGENIDMEPKNKPEKP